MTMLRVPIKDKENVFSTIFYKLKAAYEPGASSMFPFLNVLLCRVGFSSYDMIFLVK